MKMHDLGKYSAQNDIHLACSGLFTYSEEVSFPGSHGKVVSASGMFVRRIAVLSRIKRFLGTKHFAEFIWFHLKRFRGTKLPEDCPLWPAAYKVERIAPAWRTSPHGPTGSRTWNPSFP